MPLLAVRDLVLVALVLASVAGCGDDDVPLSVRLAFPSGTERPDGFIEVRVEDGAGAELRRIGPELLTSGLQLRLAGVPFGPRRRLVAEIRSSRFRNAPAAFRGSSEPFTYEFGKKKEVVIVFERVDDEATEGPDLPDPEGLVYARLPWGDGTSDAAPRAEVRVPAGWTNPGTTLFVFDGPQVDAPNLDSTDRALVLASTSPTSSEAFSLAIPGGLAAPTRIYVGLSDEDGRLSDADPEAPGLQAAFVSRSEWVAAFGGKQRGSSFPNPHAVTVASTSGSILALDPRTSEEPSQQQLDGLAVGAADLRRTAARRWRRFEDNGSPALRQNASTTFDAVRGVTLLFGGTSLLVGSDQLADLWQWDGEAWFRLDAGSGPSPREGASFAFMGRLGKAVLFGGIGSDAVPRADLWTWDGVSWAEVNVQGPSARTDAAVAYDPVRGRLVLYGGCPDPSCGIPLDDVWEFDGASWRAVPSGAVGPSPRFDASLVWDSKHQRILLVGGIGPGGAQGVADIWSWDGASWRQINDGTGGPTSTRGSVASFDRDRGQVLLLETFDGEAEPLWSFDDRGWQRVTSADGLEDGPGKRVRPAQVYDPIRKETLVFGGFSAAEDERTWAWSGKRWLVRQQRVDRRAPAAALASAAYDSRRDRIVLFGGFDGSGYSDTVWEFDGTGWIPITPPEPRPEPGLGYSMAYDAARRTVVLHGGANLVEGRIFKSLWGWNGQRWTLLDSGTGPPAQTPGLRAFGAMAYDPDLQVVVLFGGVNGTSNAPTSTWEWDGDGWTEFLPAPDVPQPEARTGHNLAFFGGCERCIEDLRGPMLVGGVGNGPVLRDQWLRRDGQWTLVEDEVPPRVDAMMAWDPVSGLLLRFGGTTSADFDYDLSQSDMWAWGGNTWTVLSPASNQPAARSGGVGLYHQVLRGMVVASGEGLPLTGGGGDVPNRYHADTWVFSSEEWREVTRGQRPRCNHRAVTHPVTDETLMYGGCTVPFCLPGLDLTWSWGSAGWTQRSSRLPSVPARDHALAPTARPSEFLLTGATLPNQRTMLFRDGSWEVTESVPVIGGESSFNREAGLVYQFGGQRLVTPIDFELTAEMFAFDEDGASRPIEATGPSARNEHAFAHMPRAGDPVDVMYGGSTSPTQVSEETWHFDADSETWLLRALDGAGPGPRAGHGLAWDPERRRLILASGRNAENLLIDDVWEYAGDSWSRVVNEGPRPSGRISFAWFYDPVRKGMILDGGQFATSCSNETWILPSAIAERPSARFDIDYGASGLAVEALRGLTVEATAGGRGHEVSEVDPAPAVEGVALLVWDAWISEWVSLTQTDRGPDAPGPLTFSSGADENVAHWVSGDGKIHIRVQPVAGLGSSARPGTVNVTTFRVTLRSRVTAD